MPVERVAATHCGEVLAHWQALKADAFAPSWADLDLSALPATFIPYASVIDVVDGGAAFRYRFWGTGMTDILGIERTGMTVYGTDAWSRTDGIGECRAVVDARQPIGVRRRAIASADDQPFSDLLAFGLRLPLTSDGMAVDHILSVFDLAADRNAWKLLFERLPHADTTSF